MEQNDMLSSLLSDPEKLQSAISMASSLLGGGGSDFSESPPDPSASEGGSPAMPSSNFSAASPRRPPNTDYDPSTELMGRAMPVINAIMRGGQTAVSHEKRNLLNAIKPFVADGVGTQLDHAMRLVSMARMARTAMRQLGQTKGTDPGTREL